MVVGVIYLILGFGVVVAAVVTNTPVMFIVGLALAVIGWVFLARARAEREEQAQYRQLMNIIGRM